MSKIISNDPQKIEEAVANYVAWVREEFPEIGSVIWFGSWVNGRPMPKSDVDLCLIIADDCPAARERPHSRPARYFPTNFPTDLDLTVVTEREWSKGEAENQALVREIRRGRVLYSI